MIVSQITLNKSTLSLFKIDSSTKKSFCILLKKINQKTFGSHPPVINRFFFFEDVNNSSFCLLKNK